MDSLELWHPRSSAQMRVSRLIGPSGPACRFRDRKIVTFLCRNSSQHVEFSHVEVPPVEDCDQSKWVHKGSPVEDRNQSKWVRKGSLVENCNPLESSCFDCPQIAFLLNNSMALPEGNLLHDLVLCLGLEEDVFLANCLISMYGQFGALLDACAVFDCMPIHNVVSWTALITCFVKNGHDMEAVQLYEDMKKSGMEPNRVSFLTVLSACTNLGSLLEGRLIHASIIEMGLASDLVVQTSLVHMYSKCNSLEEACIVFDKMQSRNVVAWTSMISAFARHEHHEEAILLFWHMQGEGVEPNEPTFMIVLSACASQKALFSGRLIHILVLLGGLDVVVGVGTALVNMYGKCGAIRDAVSVFADLKPRNLISWTAMMTAYGEHEQHEDCLLLYKQLLVEGCKLDKVTFTIALNACASLSSLNEGMQTHMSIIYFGLESDVLVRTALIDMYGKSGALLEAFALFDEVHQPDAVMWSAMISGCISEGDRKEGLKLFWQMQEGGVEPDEVAFLCVLGACASPEELGEGRSIHACFACSGFSLDLVGSSLITMYANCGTLENAQRVFQAMQDPDVVAFNALIAAFVQHGVNEKALDLFATMQLGGYDIVDVTFVNILSACAGLAAPRKGRKIHALIIEAGFQSYPPMENALINFYGKSGDLEDVHVMFNKLASRNILSWTTVMTAYAQHGLGKETLHVFTQMQQAGVMPDEVTLISLLSACSHAGIVDAGFGCLVSLSHEYGVGLMVDHLVCLVDLLGRAGRLDEAVYYLSKSPLEVRSGHCCSLLGVSTIHDHLELGRRAATYMLDSWVTPLAMWTTAETPWD